MDRKLTGFNMPMDKLNLEINLMKFGLAYISKSYIENPNENITKACLEYFRDGAALILEKEEQLEKVRSKNLQ